MLCFSFTAIVSQAQIFWSENFNNGCNSDCLAANYTGPNGSWTVTKTGNNDTKANVWYVSCAENGNVVGQCGSSCGSDATLHVGSNDGIIHDIGAAYDAGGGYPLNTTTDIRAESPVINCTGHSDILLSFKYMEGGQEGTDNATVWYSTGSSWSLLCDPAKTALTCTKQGLWTAYSVALPATCNNNANVKIGFRWINNNDGIGKNPSFAIDSVELGTTPPSPTTLNLTFFLEGFVKANGYMNSAKNSNFTPQWGANITDTFRVELHNSQSYSTIVCSQYNIYVDTLGHATLTIPGAYHGNYYVTLVQRNHMTTVSANPVSFDGSTTNYDFSSSNSKSYGNSMKAIGGKYALYCGDITQAGQEYEYPNTPVPDGMIDMDDMYYVYDSYGNGDIGYLRQDVNGDGHVNLTDANLVYYNNILGIYMQTPD